MNLTDLTELRTELAAQAAVMDDRSADLVSGAKRHARRVRARRTVAIAASVAAVSWGTFTAVQAGTGDAGTITDAPVASATAATPEVVAPSNGVIPDRQRVRLSDGVTLEMVGDLWLLQTPSGTTGDSIYTRPDGAHGVYAGALPGHRFYSLNIFTGTAAKVTYRVGLPGHPAKTYRADVYSLAGVPGFTLAFVTYPVGDFEVTPQTERQLDITFKAWDAKGRPVRTS